MSNQDFEDMDLTDNREDGSFELENTTPENDEFKQKYYHKTDTSNYDSSEMEVFSPEDVEQERLDQIRNQRFANDEFGTAVESIESKLGREINFDEFDKLCRSYATVLCEEDAKLLKSGKVDGEARKRYYDDLIHNRKVTRVVRGYYENIETIKVNDIRKELERVKSIPTGELEVKSGKPVNYRHKGKVKIRDNEKGLLYVIDNNADVKLFNMRNRQEWLDKRYPEEIAEASGDVGGRIDDDGFV